MMTIRTGLAVLIASLAWAVSVMAQSPPEPAQTAPSDGATTVASASESKARTLIENMGRYYSELNEAEVTVDLSVFADVHNKPVIFANRFQYAFKRPNQYFRLASETAPNETPRSQIVSNGQTTTQYYHEFNKYVVEPQPLDFAQSLDTDDPGATGVLDMITFFAYLIQSDATSAFLDQMTELKYSGTETINDVEMHKVEMMFNDAKSDFWIDAGDKPLLHRIRMDVSELIPVRGLPPNTPLIAGIEFSDWKPGAVAAERFVFQPPQGAEQSKSLDALMMEGMLKQVAEESKNHPLVGKPAPDFTLPLLEGGELKLSDHKGQNVVVLDFWATWCPPCILSMPTLIDVTNGLKDRNVRLVTVNLQQEKNVIEPFMQKQKWNMTVAMDKTGKVSATYGAQNIPFTVIVGKDGLVKRVHKGTMRDQDLARQLLQMELEEILEEK